MKCVESVKKEGLDGISFDISTDKNTVKMRYYMTIDERLDTIFNLTQWAHKNNLLTRCYLSECFGSPIGEKPKSKEITSIIKNLDSNNVNEIILQDTFGVYNIKNSLRLIDEIKIPKDKLSIHFYDSTLHGLEMIIGALSRGISKITTTIGGLGRHKHYEDIIGNVVASDLVFALDCLEIKHDVKWQELLIAEKKVCRWMRTENLSDVFSIDFKDKMQKYKEMIQKEMQKKRS